MNLVRADFFHCLTLFPLTFPSHPSAFWYFFDRKIISMFRTKQIKSHWCLPMHALSCYQTDKWINILLGHILPFHILTGIWLCVFFFSSCYSRYFPVHILWANGEYLKLAKMMWIVKGRELNNKQKCSTKNKINVVRFRDHL